MLRDEAKCFLDAGGLIEVSDMVLRMLRVALPPGRLRRRPTAMRLSLLQAMGAFHAYLRVVTAPPNAHPVARFLLFERAYPGQRGRMRGLAARGSSRAPTRARATPSRYCGSSRLAADLDFRAARCPTAAELPGICERRQQELARTTTTSPTDTSGGSPPTSRGPNARALRDPLPHRVPLDGR